MLVEKSSSSGCSPLPTNTTATMSTAAAGSSSSSSSVKKIERSVARPVANLGNTCYMNAVLQALAHAPELYTAIDGQPHTQTCPIAKANAAKLLQQQQQKSQSSASSRTNSPIIPDPSDIHQIMTMSKPLQPTRKSARRSAASGRRSPRNGNGAGGGGDGSSDDGCTYCALCEVEQHLRLVHPELTQSSSSGTTATGKSTSKQDKLQPVAPVQFVHGFMEHTAPWFKLGVQEDSHEFLRLLIDAMQQSCQNARKKNKELQRQQEQQQQQQDDNAMKPQDDNPQDDSNDSNNNLNNGAQENTTNQMDSKEDTEYPFSLFRGTVESNVTCGECHASSCKRDPIEDIGLDVMVTTTSAGAAGGSSASPLAAAADAPPPPPPTRSSSRSRNSSPVPPSASSAAPNTMFIPDVQAALSRFARAEALDSGYKCEKCGRLGSATKQSRLATVPPILTLHLKRFRYATAQDAAGGRGGGVAGGGAAGGSSRRSTRISSANRTAAAEASNGLPSSQNGGGNQNNGNGSSGGQQQNVGATDSYFSGGKLSLGAAKIEGHVRFPEMLDLTPYLTAEQQERKHQQSVPNLCRLFAVLVHSGKSSHSGHYFSYVLNLSNYKEWWRMDDGRVSLVDKSQVLQAEAYMLFYRVVDHPISVQLKKELAAKQQLAAQRQQQLVVDQGTDAGPSNTTAGESASESNNNNKKDAANCNSSTSRSVENEATLTDNNPAFSMETATASGIAGIKKHSEADVAAEGRNTKTLRSETKNPRKRSAAAFTEEDDAMVWARTKARFPPSWSGLMRRLQEAVAENTQLSSEFFRSISQLADQGLKSDNNVDNNNRGSAEKLFRSLGEKDVVNGTEHFKKDLCKIFYELSNILKQQQKASNGTTEGADLAHGFLVVPSTHSSRGALRDANNKDENIAIKRTAQEVVVVEAEEANVL